MCSLCCLPVRAWRIDLVAFMVDVLDHIEVKRDETIRRGVPSVVSGVGVKH